MFTLFSTPLFTPLGPDFSCCYRPSARSNASHFSLPEASGLTGALKWSRHGPPSLLAAPTRLVVGPDRRPLGGLPAWSTAGSRGRGLPASGGLRGEGGAIREWTPRPASP